MSNPELSNPEYKNNLIDFLNPNLDLSMEMSDEAFEYLPEISKEEIETKKEKYRILLGKWESTVSNEVKLRIKGILDVPDDPRYYKEGVYEVELNLPAIKDLVASLQEHYPEYGDLDLLGDFHTHPVDQSNLDEQQRSWHPSEGDIEAYIDLAKKKEIGLEKPFIFGIAGPTEDGKTGYAFYRVVKDDENYDFRKVDWK